MIKAFNEIFVTDIFSVGDMSSQCLRARLRACSQSQPLVLRKVGEDCQLKPP